MRATALRPRRLPRCPALSPASSSSCAGAAAARGRPLSTGISSDSLLREIPEGVTSKLGRNLHNTEGHPLYVIKKTIEMHFEEEGQRSGGEPFAFFDSLSPEVTTHQNFDELLIPTDHVSRGPTDTFYLSDTTVLRTHTSAHQNELMRSGHTSFLCTGDVYRRDTVDRTHYPVFHQVEGVKLFAQWGNGQDAADRVEEDMKAALDGLARKLFGDEIQTRWSPDFFPFTDPSWELEIMHQGEWLEVLGCGVVQQQILTNCELQHGRGWAFGLGLERLAMVLFNIPDIRLFWTEDPRFHSQVGGLKMDAFSIEKRDIFPLKNGDICMKPGDFTTFPQFQSYSKYPECYKDVSFWLPESGEGVLDFHENLMHETVRTVGGDLIEEVVLTDAFTHPKTGRTSHCYRVNYRATDRSLSNKEVDEMQFRIRDLLAERLGVELR